ncbi:MAG: phosphate ABC transporter permease PstA [Bacillota bacterium]|nr:phosphate ABC transporter permease PstA [Bacillota bacterium]
MNNKLADKIWTVIFYIISGLVVLLLLSLLSIIIYRGRTSLNLTFITTGAKFGEAGGGIGPQLFNSFYMLFISLLISIPIGVGAGIYLAEYAKEGILIRAVRLCIETMASLPSIVVGLFGLLIFVNLTGLGFTLLSGALAITIINLPSLTRVSENAIKDAGRYVKEASLGLGATRFQTIRKVILPAAMPQILTGVILAAGRIFGEAAALLYTSGMSAPVLDFSLNNIFTQNSPFSLLRPAETLAVYIWKLNSEGLAVDAAKIANGASAVLVIMVLLFNLFARLIGNKIHESYSGK